MLAQGGHQDGQSLRIQSSDILDVPCVVMLVYEFCKRSQNEWLRGAPHLLRRVGKRCRQSGRNHKVSDTDMWTEGLVQAAEIDYRRRGIVTLQCT